MKNLIVILLTGIILIALSGAVKPSIPPAKFTGITYAEGYLYAITEKGQIYKETHKEGLGGYAPKMDSWTLVGSVKGK